MKKTDLRQRFCRPRVTCQGHRWVTACHGVYRAKRSSSATGVLQASINCSCELPKDTLFPSRGFRPAVMGKLSALCPDFPVSWSVCLENKLFLNTVIGLAVSKIRTFLLSSMCLRLNEVIKHCRLSVFWSRAQGCLHQVVSTECHLK